MYGRPRSTSTPLTFWCLNSMDPSDRPPSFGARALRWSDFLKGLPRSSFFEHGEVVGDDQADFLLAPVLVGRLLFFGGFLALADHGEAELPQDEVRLPWSLAAAELFGLEDAAKVSSGRPGRRRLSGRIACRRGRVRSRWAGRRGGRSRRPGPPACGGRVPASDLEGSTAA